MTRKNAEAPAEDGPAPGGATAERILAAAFEAFMAEGYARTSTLKIATRAKASKRELYALFGSKEEILRACIAARARRMRPPEAPPTPRSGAELQTTLATLGARLIAEICHPTVVAVQSLAVAEAGRSPELGQELERVREQINANISELIGRAQEVGLLRVGDSSAMGYDFQSLLLGNLLVRLMQRVVETPNAAQAERRARAAAAMFVQIYGA
ncbi:MAG TPA: TetR/AcrR family transcriptional regulator [Phenylobacterium sp.]|nr:TetR/AcrR family transcriptional regulator [Phenylobacterium sp.]